MRPSHILVNCGSPYARQSKPVTPYIVYGKENMKPVIISALFSVFSSILATKMNY
jgi:hypothetical protein